MSGTIHSGGRAVVRVGNLSVTKAMAPGVVALAVLVALSFSQVSSADMGRIRTTEARVEETAQKAIILHNLEEEVLILGTDLEADRETTILRFIPFPSEPQVSLPEGDPFAAVAELMRKHKLVFVSTSKGGDRSAEPVEIRMNARLGARDITVVKVNEIQSWSPSRTGSRAESSSTRSRRPIRSAAEAAGAW